MAPAAPKERQPVWLRTVSIIAYSFSFLVFGLEVNLLGPSAIDLANQIGVEEADLVGGSCCLDPSFGLLGFIIHQAP
jgi:hypothetical protein